MSFMNRLLCALAILLVWPNASGAQQSTDAPSADSDPVLVFNRVCYAQVPVIRNIRDMAARLAWEPIGGEDLQQFTTIDDPEVLEGWDVRIAKRLYRLGVVRSDLAETAQAAFPEFADGNATSCSLVLDGNDDADVIANRLQLLAGKEPDSENVAEGDLRTTTWAGGNEDFKVFIFFKADLGGKANLINVTIFSKEDV